MPSLSFYITSLGGSQDFYGFVLAIYSFMSFCGKPILGRWSDATSFKIPYMVSISFSVFGGFLYAIAPVFTNNQTALASVALGRIFGGLGRANSALNFAYVARACEAKDRTSITVLLGGVQMIGMAIAPLFSATLVNADFTFCGVHFDNLNSVGLILVILNLFSQVMVTMFLPDLPRVEGNGSEKEESESEGLRILRCILSNPQIAVPFFTILTFNFNWQLIETALAPAGQDIFGWGPVEISFMLGGMAFITCAGMITVHKLSRSDVSDFKLLCSGLTGNSLGYLLLYIMWHRGVSVAGFVGPIIVGTSAFPFMGAPNRSLFSAAVDLTPELAGHEGTMQALLSMSSSIGGFTAPFIVTRYWLRTPEEVSSSNDSREFGPWALFSPLLGLVCLTATFMAGEAEKKVEGVGPDETTPLDGKSPSKRRLSAVEVGRRASARASMCTSMTIIPPDGDMFEEDV